MTTASFNVARTATVNQQCNVGASTSYLHLSGRSASRQQGEGLEPEQLVGAAVEEVDDDMDGADAQDFLYETTSRLATTGQAVASSVAYMRGHGAYLSSTASASPHESSGASPSAAPLIRSALCGLVRKTNKLISVASLKTRYAPEVGDLVVGRITDVQPGNRRWKVDVGSRQEANLMLSSINLPGGIQRRKLDSDELEMRSFFKEGDLLVCEVQSLFHDGSTSLHTRSLNYGKLRNGQMASVNACLIRRLKRHFMRIDRLGLEVIIGLNGAVWVCMLDTGKVNITTGTGRDIEAIYSDVNDKVPNATRRRIARMLDIVALLSYYHCPISDIALLQGYDASITFAPLAEQDDFDHQDQAAADFAPDGTLSDDVRQSVLEVVYSKLG